MFLITVNKFILIYVSFACEIFAVLHYTNTRTAVSAECMAVDFTPSVARII